MPEVTWIYVFNYRNSNVKRRDSSYSGILSYEFMIEWKLETWNRHTSFVTRSMRWRRGSKHGTSASRRLHCIPYWRRFPLLRPSSFSRCYCRACRTARIYSPSNERPTILVSCTLFHNWQFYRNFAHAESFWSYRTFVSKKRERSCTLFHNWQFYRNVAHAGNFWSCRTYVCVFVRVCERKRREREYCCFSCYLNKKTLTPQAIKSGFPIPQITEREYCCFSCYLNKENVNATIFRCPKSHFFGYDAIASNTQNYKCLIFSQTYYFQGRG